MKTEKCCKKCWWESVCNKLPLSCVFFQEVDIRWDDCPNNKQRNKICVEMKK